MVKLSRLTKFIIIFITIVLIFLTAYVIITVMIWGTWSSPPPTTKFQNLEELSVSLADENMWFFDLDLGVDETNYEKEEYFIRIESVSGGGCTEKKEHFNYYDVNKNLIKGTAYLQYGINGFSSSRISDFFEEYNFDGIPGMLSCNVNNLIDDEGYGSYRCKFVFYFVINDKSYSIWVEQYTWKNQYEDIAEAEDSVFGKIITKEIFLELVETALLNRFQ